MVHNALVGGDLREEIEVIASGKILTGFDMATRLAVGADHCNAARGFIFALGCIQARLRNANTCPVGVTTQDPRLVRGLDVQDKCERVFGFHDETIERLLEILSAACLGTCFEGRFGKIFRVIASERNSRCEG